MGKCKFQKEWLERKDSSGCKISVWGERRGDSGLLCVFCQNLISTVKGFYYIRQHYETDRHKKMCLEKLDGNQLHLSTNKDDEASGMRLYSVKDSAYTAELIWCLKMISGNIPTNFCQDIAHVFRAMFPSPGAVPEELSLNPTKARYLISDALGPHFRKKILNDIGSSYFTLLFDETTNNAGAKELQTAVRYWSEERRNVATCHLETFFLGHATAETVKAHLLKALDNADLPQAKLLMLGSDGPKVNQKVFLLMNEDVKAVRGKGLVNLGFCNIHMVHNAFQKGLEELGSDASELIISLYSFFKDWPSRWEDFCLILDQMDLPNVRFLKHVSSRWLTIEAAAQRLLGHWDAVIEYFLKFVPLKQATLLKTNAFKRILPLLKKSTIKAELKFICVSAGLFQGFTGLYQKNEPLVHVLSKHINELIIVIMGRSCKKKAVKSYAEGITENAFQAKNLLPVQEIVLGDDLDSLLAHVSSAEKDQFTLQIRNHYTAAGKYILEKNLIFSQVLKRFRCLRPESQQAQKSLNLWPLYCLSLMMKRNSWMR